MIVPAPRVTAITIFFNAEAYFADAIESVLAQNFRNFEYLLVDDGSTDRSTEIARDYAERHPGLIRWLEHPGHANRGMSATRNLGIRCARGEFIAFIDADDIWRPSKLQEQVAIMDAHPGLGAVAGVVNYWWSWSGHEDVLIPTGHRYDQPLSPPEASLALYPLGRAAAPCPSDLMLRRSAVERVGGFEEHFTGPRQMYEDQGFLAKLYLATPVLFASRCWLDYRQHDDSCVASVAREGLYHEVRHYFLRWFDGYLSTSMAPGVAAVRRAVRRSLLRYEYPRLAALADRVHWGPSPRRLIRRLARVMG